MRELVPASRVRARIAELVERIANDPAPEPCLVVIAEGARRFADALVGGLRERGVEPDVRVLRARRTHGSRLEEVRLDRDKPLDLEGRDVLVVDDVIDEGRTLEAVVGLIEKQSPRSIRICVLVSRLGRRAVPLTLDHVGFELGGGWIVGMGMDLDGRYRDLDYIGIAVGAEGEELQ